MLHCGFRPNVDDGLREHGERGICHIQLFRIRFLPKPLSLVDAEHSAADLRGLLRPQLSTALVLVRRNPRAERRDPQGALLIEAKTRSSQSSFYGTKTHCQEKSRLKAA